MAEIRPFKGVLYNGKQLEGGFTRVVAPPYDVISEKERDVLYDSSPYNIIRLILGKDMPDDNGGGNKYTRAREMLECWLADRILVRDEVPGLYVYMQEYKDHKGRECKRIGFLGLLKIGEKAGDTLLPHEHTLSKPKADRMNLMKEVKGNLSPIFGLYSDPEKVIKNVLETVPADPVLDITVKGERHVLWRLTSREKIKIVTDRLKESDLFIADGHHRYEVARAFRDHCRQEPGYDGYADHVMVYLTDMADKDNLTVMATHRVLKKVNTDDVDAAVSRLSKYFNVEECGSLSELEKNIDEAFGGPTAMGLIMSGKYVFLRAVDPRALAELMDGDHTDEWRMLDVSVLHAAVLEKILGTKSEEGNITYVKNSEDAEALVNDGTHVAAFILNPTLVDQMRVVAEKGEMMPQKSTYFYPKLLTGLVINRFEV